jgi:hypothetical protein
MWLDGNVLSDAAAPSPSPSPRCSLGENGNRYALASPTKSVSVSSSSTPTVPTRTLRAEHFDDLVARVRRLCEACAGFRGSSAEVFQGSIELRNQIDVHHLAEDEQAKLKSILEAGGLNIDKQLVLLGYHSNAEIRAQAIAVLLVLVRLDPASIETVIEKAKMLLFDGDHDAAQAHVIELFLGLMQTPNVSIACRVRAASIALLRGNDAAKEQALGLLLVLAQMPNAPVDSIMGLASRLLYEQHNAAQEHAVALFLVLAQSENRPFAVRVEAVIKVLEYGDAEAKAQAEELLSGLLQLELLPNAIHLSVVYRLFQHTWE